MIYPVGTGIARPSSSVAGIGVEPAAGNQIIRGNVYAGIHDSEW